MIRFHVPHAMLACLFFVAGCSSGDKGVSGAVGNDADPLLVEQKSSEQPIDVPVDPVTTRVLAFETPEGVEEGAFQFKLINGVWHEKVPENYTFEGGGEWWALLGRLRLTLTDEAMQAAADSIISANGHTRRRWLRSSPSCVLTFESETDSSRFMRNDVPLIDVIDAYLAHDDVFRIVQPSSVGELAWPSINEQQ